MPLDTVLRFATEHSAWLGVMAAGSVVFIVASALFVPWWIRRIPDDQLERLRHGKPRHPGNTRLIWIILRNAAAILVLISGAVMLVAPGQGLLTILAALLLMSFPGKRRFIAWILNMKWSRSILKRIRSKRTPHRQQGRPSAGP